MLICGNWTRHSCQNNPMRGHLGETLSPLTSLLDGVTLQQSPSLNEMLSEKCNSCSSTRRNMLASSAASVVRTYIIAAPVSCLPFSQSPGGKDHTSVVAAMCNPPPAKLHIPCLKIAFTLKRLDTCTTVYSVCNEEKKLRCSELNVWKWLDIASSPGANQGQAPVVYIITQQDTDHAAC